MTLRDHYKRLYEHAHWANRRILDALRGISDDAEAMQEKKLFAHLIAAERVWLTRLEGIDSSGLAIWPAYSLQGCEELAEANADGYRDYLDRITDADCGSVIAYRNSTGQEFHTAIGDILAHVALHGSYHRGQIASFLRTDGFTPVSTDYILYARET
jgi:uncharacterized damage-inducible protein DinB